MIPRRFSMRREAFSGPSTSMSQELFLLIRPLRLSFCTVNPASRRPLCVPCPYQNFVQSLTFEMVVLHANRQLVKMTDRYFLVPDRLKPLDLNVIDNYQGGEVRSTRNFSGGESFIVSLALALGLSHMSSCWGRVDSLFLDEGFGTLDEDSLETALDALSGIQQHGKLIGIISHVAVLRDRLTTQIAVRPLSGGKSTLIGPGVSSPSC